MSSQTKNPVARAGANRVAITVRGTVNASAPNLIEWRLESLSARHRRYFWSMRAELPAGMNAGGRI